MDFQILMDAPLVIGDGWAEREKERAQFLGALLKASEKLDKEDHEAAKSLARMLSGVPRGKRLRGWNLRYDPDTGELIERTPWYD
jgi:5-formyltetrahydrofolate cyclo-ligase